jgi:hypothetical protein
LLAVIVASPVSLAIWIIIVAIVCILAIKVLVGVVL